MAEKMKQTDEDPAAPMVRVAHALASDIIRDRKVPVVRISRNIWILEAVVEKIERDKHGRRKESGHGGGDGPK